MMHAEGLSMLKHQLAAWAAHLHRHKLTDRKDFVSWLSKAITAAEFALLVDAEIDRRSLWEAYLQDMFGP